MSLLVLRRLLRRKLAVIGLALIIACMMAGVFAHSIAPHDPYAVNVLAKLQPSSWEYPMGTDQLGRCVFSRIVYGARTSLGTGLAVTAAILLLGVPLGLLSGYIGGALDNVIMRLVDIATTFPSSMLALALVGLYGPSLLLLVTVFILLWWAPFARLVRGMVIKVKEQDFVLAAESGGCSRLNIVVRHILPNVLSPIIVYASLRVAAVITHMAVFSFIGLGSQPPTADWGVMLSDGRQFLTSKPMLLFWPGLAIMLTVLAFNLFGEGLGEALTPDAEDLATVKEDEIGPPLSSGRVPLTRKIDPVTHASVQNNDQPTLSLRGLKTWFASGTRIIKAVNGVDLDAYPGRITAVVGGSGSGKSVMALSIINLIDKPGWIESGEARINGMDLLALDEKQLQSVRGRLVSMVFQDPVGSMNPVVKVKKHLFEAARTPFRQRREAMREFKQILARIGLKDPDKVLESYPFELSGGMCQRVMVAMGLVARAQLLIADEPTSSLDLTTQAAILQEFQRLRDTGLAILLITHDLGVVAQTADDVYVINDGCIVEHGRVEDVLLNPRHDYTKRLLSSVAEEVA